MTITFIPLTESHFPLLLKWLETPHVKAWWDTDVIWTPELIQDKYETYVKGYKLEGGIPKPIQAFIIHVDETPVGYIQYYNKHDFPLEQGAEITILPESSAAMDCYIGEADFIGKGIGPKILDLFLEQHVFPHFDHVFVDPDKANISTIRAYEKAGFHEIDSVSGGKAMWMMRKKLKKRSTK